MMKLKVNNNNIQQEMQHLVHIWHFRHNKQRIINFQKKTGGKRAKHNFKYVCNMFTIINP